MRSILSVPKENCYADRTYSYYLRRGGQVQKLIEGIHHFQREVFPRKEVLFKRLAGGQSPQALFITCSDSRIDPWLITHSEPGDLFVLRNVGNLVPPYGTGGGAEAAAIEFAIVELQVPDIVICGHSMCGAMIGLVEPSRISHMPAVKQWLRGAEATQRILKDNYAHLSGDALLLACVEENVLIQLENLETYPSVASALEHKAVTLHGWVYHFETSEVFSYNPKKEQFQTLTL